MKKLEMKTIDGVQENLSKIEQLFPTVITESADEKGNIVKAVDFEKLKKELSAVVSKGKETYEFRWVGKDNAIVEANTKTDKALRPCKEESKNWDTTENLYLEGDNLDVLKILKNSYKNKVKMIYIDPPYNTGNDSFVYPDDYSKNKDEYDEEVGAVNENGYRMVKNTEANGRFHSVWCSMMYPCLKLARDLLTEDGIIFISIDDHEVENLRKICDEIFGENNFVSEFIWKCRTSLQHTEPLVSKQTERVLLYVKNKTLWNEDNKLSFNRIRKPYDATEYKNPDNDPRGPWLSSGKTRNDGRPSYTVTSPTGVKFTKPWIPSPAEFKRWEDEKLIWWGINGDSIPRKKSFLKDFKGNAISDILFDEYLVEPIDENNVKRTKIWEIGTTESGTKSLKELFDEKSVFPYPKPTSLIKYFSQIATSNEDLILDFFSGSATTAHAVMQLNAEEGGKRKFIMVQLPEGCDEKSEAYKAGYKNICEIGKERIRRAGEKIVKETGKTDLDIGFRVYKLDSGNYEQVFKAPGDLKQSDLENAIETIKRDRTDEDLLFGTLLAWGADTCLSMSYDVVLVGKYKIYVVKKGAVPELVACFDEDVNDEVIRKMAEYKPMRVAFRERGLKTVERRANAENLLKQLHPLLEENDIRLI